MNHIAKTLRETIYENNCKWHSKWYNFFLKEDGSTECKESKYCGMISDCAKKTLEYARQKIKKGLHPIVILDIANQLEKIQEVDIKIKKAIEYKDKTTVIHYLNLPENKDNSKLLFLKGKFKTDGKFEVLVDFSAKVYNPEGELDKTYSGMLQMWLEELARKFRGPHIPDENYAVYQVLNKEIPALTTIEKACFYYYPINPKVLY